MGMTINDAKCCLENGIDVCNASCKYFSKGDPNCKDNVRKIAIDIMRKYQQLQTNYENCLKAEKIAILEDLKKEINPIKKCEYQIYGKEHWGFVGKCQDVIQQKIDSLKKVIK